MLLQRLGNVTREGDKKMNDFCVWLRETVNFLRDINNTFGNAQ